MHGKDEINRFLREGFAEGRAAEDLAAALRDAGWPEDRIQAGLAQWHRIEGLPPVPRPRRTLSPRDALVHGLGFAALAILSWHVTRIGILAVEELTPAAGDTHTWGGSARWPVSMLVVFLPIFVLIHLRRPADDSSLVRRWLAALSGFLAGMTLLGTLATAVQAFLAGDLTLRFALKALVVVVTAGLVFVTYRGELAGARAGRGGAAALAGLAGLGILAGLWLSGGPGQGRAEARDEARRSDLSELATQARCLALEGEDVPPIDTSEGCPEAPPSADPWTGEPYRIERLPAGTLRLCASYETERFRDEGPAGPGCISVDLARPGEAG